MARYVLAVLAILVASFATTITAASPPRPGSELNGLTPNESATLWSRDSDDTTQAAFQQRGGGSGSSMAQLANQTDITFTQPPATAAIWTRHDFQDLRPGGPRTAVAPTDADRTGGAYIADAHASIFTVQPSTRAHQAPGDAPLYVAPSGVVRGLVDYRVRTPNNTSLVSHAVEAVRLRADGRVVNSTAGTQMPVLGYRLNDDGRVTLTLEAEITAEVRVPVGNGRTATTVTESVVVRDSVDVRVYDLTVRTHFAEYPDGDTGVAVFQSVPWQGYTLSENGSRRVRGVWRFYTARDTDWGTLVHSTSRGERRVQSPALPVYVHAYPSRIGPREAPVRGGPMLVDVWGPAKPSPGAPGENVHVDVVDGRYTASYGLAVRTATDVRQGLNIAGIVRGVAARSSPPQARSERRLRNSTLTTRFVSQSGDQATIRLELRDGVTGAPIHLEGSPRLDALDAHGRDGYLVVANQRVQTNASGVAVVTLDEPGVYSVRYEPGSWVDHDPAYVRDTATVRWHPLTTLEGWRSLATTSLWQLAPFLVVLYAGYRLQTLLSPRRQR